MYNETDCYTTVLGFTNSIREAVLCVVMKATQLEYYEKYRIDLYSLCTSMDGSDLDFKRNINTGEGKQFPGGLTFIYKGKQIEALVYTSEEGSISCDILVKIFHKMDYLELFNCSVATPIVILDGYDS